MIFEDINDNHGGAAVLRYATHNLACLPGNLCYSNFLDHFSLAVCTWSTAGTCLSDAISEHERIATTLLGLWLLHQHSRSCRKMQLGHQTSLLSSLCTACSIYTVCRTPLDSSPLACRSLLGDIDRKHCHDEAGHEHCKWHTPWMPYLCRTAGWLRRQQRTVQKAAQ